MLLTLNAAQVITLYVFEAIIAAAFLCLFFAGDPLDRRYQKIIGGLAAFCIAIIAQHPWVYTVSLFIGGLIIASEDFMKFLVAIMRSKPDQVHKTINAMQPQVPSPAELVEKEELQAQAQLPQSSQNDEARRSSYDSFIRQSRDIENEVLQWFEKQYGNRFRRDIKIENSNGAAIFDGAILTKDGNVHEAIEIKFLRSKSLVPSVMRIRQFLERYAFLNLPIFIRLIIILDDASSEQVESLIAEIDKRFGNRPEFSFKVLPRNESGVDLSYLETEKSSLNMN